MIYGAEKRLNKPQELPPHTSCCQLGVRGWAPSPNTNNTQPAKHIHSLNSSLNSPSATAPLTGRLITPAGKARTKISWADWRKRLNGVWRQSRVRLQGVRETTRWKRDRIKKDHYQNYLYRWWWKANLSLNLIVGAITKTELGCAWQFSSKWWAYTAPST